MNYIPNSFHIVSFDIVIWWAVSCVVKVSAHGSVGRRCDTRLYQLSD